MRPVAGRARALALCGVALLPMMAWAQQASLPPAVTQQAPPASPASASALDPGLFLRGAGQTLALLDQGRIGEVWDGGSVALKQAIARDAFIAQVRAGQAEQGAPARREWVSISVRSAGADAGPRLPQGRYVSVAYSTAFAKASGREVVSFRLEPDGQWRVTGYVVN